MNSNTQLLEAAQPKSKKSKKTHVYDTIVVGAGISGLAAAVKMKQSGYDDYIVIEKAAEVGGTWRDNTYPGCGCDVPSALYSFSFAPSSKWSHLFAKQIEILEYLKDVATEYELYPKIQLNTSMDEAVWNDQDKLWELKTSKGQMRGKTIVLSTGPITEPQLPKIKGIESFQGEMFHSARWNHDYDLTGKRIAVIGTGASAIQFIPQIQPLAKELYVFQRTAPWILPKPDMKLGHQIKNWIERYPNIQRTWRGAISQSLNLINLGLRNPDYLQPVNYLGKKLIQLQIKDQKLRQDVTPNYSIGCKRLLFANNYYPTLQQDNTHLIPFGLVEIDGNTVISSNGDRHEVDVIIWGTGFEVAHPPIGNKIYDLDGQLLADRWKKSSPEAYLGTNISRLPNAFLVLGPNILVYDSFIGIAEAQLGYIVDGLKKIKAQKINRLLIKEDVITNHNNLVQKHLKTTVFNAGGCKSYYLDENGRNFAAWPWSLKVLKRQLNTLNLANYHLS